MYLLISGIDGAYIYFPETVNREAQKAVKGFSASFPVPMVQNCSVSFLFHLDVLQYEQTNKITHRNIENSKIIESTGAWVDLS